MVYDVQLIVGLFEQHSDDERAAGMAAYMKNRFFFFGIGAPLRKQIQKPFLVKSALPPIDGLEEVVTLLWDHPARELHYFAIDLVEKHGAIFRRGDLELLTFMASHQQWWDSIDAIASKLMGAYFTRYPQERYPAVERWLMTGDFWLQRCAILFQLKYKSKTDTSLLEAAILPVRQSNEFFIQKAIGWALREYRKTNREWVDDFIHRVELKPLSRREALKHK
jgi:3-methyladenine DNA glycosylase AlkD